MGLIDSITLAEEIESLEITVAGKPARWYDAKHTVLRIIAEQKEADAVQVVKCKNCRYRSLTNGSMRVSSYKCNYTYSPCRGRIVEPTFGCVLGKPGDMREEDW